ncbi:MAG: chloride channel protein [Leptospiraceae bacterium]|nr:chloride channel protein [Leptospiraceae bacterium]MCB1304184.1 chloride channel protein [Leptospiraceae bacterium]
MGIRNPRRVYVYSLIIGLATGAGAVLFHTALAHAEHFTFDYIIGLRRSYPAGEHPVGGEPLVPFNPWLMVLLPVLGGLLCGLVVHFLSADAAGSGTDTMINAFHRKEGKVSSRIPLYKSIATVFTISSGGSAGPEGPIMQIGGGIGSAIARFVGAGARARRTLMLAGIAGGLGAVFRAPLGGALTAVEVVYREDIESDSLIPCILASVTAYLVARAAGSQSSIFAVPDVALHHYHELIFYVILGVVCTGIGYLFTLFFNFIRDSFSELKIHPIMKPALGGLMVGLVGVMFPEVYGSGFGYMQQVILGKNPFLAGSPDTAMALSAASPHGFAAEPLAIVGFFLTVALLKTVTTSFTVATGGSGGIFAPALFIGGMLGGAVGTLANYFFPGLDISVPSFILVGMAGFFSGVAGAPMAGMITVCDIVGSYALLPPLMIVSIISAVMSHKWSVYRGQVKNRFESPAHYYDMNLDILDSLTIEKAFKEYRMQAVCENHMLLSNLEDRAHEIQASDFIVIDSSSKYRGICSLRKVHHTKFTDTIRMLVTVEDVLDTVPPLRPDDTLARALRVLMHSEVDKFAIIDNSGMLLGYLRFNDVFQAYHDKVRPLQPQQVPQP